METPEVDAVVPRILRSLAMAIIDSSAAPLVLLDDDGTIVGASQSFAAIFGFTDTDLAGKSLYGLDEGAWDAPALRRLLEAAVADTPRSGSNEIDLEIAGRSTRRLVLNACKLDYLEDDEPATRLLLGVADVTDARAREALHDQLLREKALLIQEVQHRVANSLQIIASVLLQSARRVGTSESREHLEAAHGRVVAIAKVQRLLAESVVDEIDIGAYLATLCESLTASMVDPGRIVLKTETDGSRIAGSVSVTIGLVVTELVINALKHAFPDGRAGTVTVGYTNDTNGWSVVVADDGIGMAASGNTHAGLGSNIVATLARHLKADVIIADAKPGTNVTVRGVSTASDAIAA